MCQEHGPIVRGRGRLRRPGRWAIGTALCWRRGVHKLGHVPDPTDLQEDQIRALHATSAPAEMKLAVTSEGDNRGNLTD